VLWDLKLPNFFRPEPGEVEFKGDVHDVNSRRGQRIVPLFSWGRGRGLGDGKGTGCPEKAFLSEDRAPEIGLTGPDTEELLLGCTDSGTESACLVLNEGGEILCDFSSS
jgi:hypothetical protein